MSRKSATQIDLGKCRITHPDPLNWVLQKRGIPTKENPEGKWKVIGYYGKLKDLATYLLTLDLQSDLELDLAGQLDDLLQQIEKSEYLLCKALEDI